MNQNKYESIRKIRDNLEAFLDGTLKEDVHVVLPENMSKTFLLNNKPTEVNEVKWLSGCYNIIHTILELSFDKRYFKGKRGSYVPLESKILKRVCGTFYKPVFIENLIRLKIIESDGKYSKLKHSSLGYRLSKKYRGQPLKNRTIRDPGIKKAIIRHRKERLAELKKRVRPIAHLARWAIHEKLELNKPEALQYLESYRYRILKEIAKRKLKPGFQRKETEFVNTRYFKARYQVESWRSSSRITVDEAGGRLYTRVTGLMSPLRHFLTYNGESLVTFDLRNSQPLHFLLLLQPGFWKKDAVGLSLEKLDIDLYKYISNLGNSTPTIKTILSAQTPASKGFLNPGFRFLVQNGKLYEFMCKRFFDKFQSGNALRFNTRNKTKMEFLKLMYFNPDERYSSSHAPFKEFQKLFPVEATVMTLLKKRDYRDFSILLQKIEARVLLHEVCRDAYDISPEIPLFTVHDSVITTEQCAPVVDEVLLKKYTEILGFPPQLKRESLNSEAADLENMKYVKGKIDQADIEVTKGQPITTNMLSFLKCEHWNIDIVIKKIMGTNLTYLSAIKRIPDFNFPIKDNGSR